MKTFKRRDKVEVAYAEKDAPEFCHYFGPGTFLRYLKGNEAAMWPDDEMCCVLIKGEGECYFPVKHVSKQ